MFRFRKRGTSRTVDPVTQTLAICTPKHSEAVPKGIYPVVFFQMILEWLWDNQYIAKQANRVKDHFKRFKSIHI